MGTEGLEPSRTITRQWILSPPCLPIPPHPLYSHIKYIKYIRKKQHYRKIAVGGTQIRTGDRGFAIHCLTTWPYRLFSHCKLLLSAL